MLSQPGADSRVIENFIQHKSRLTLRAADLRLMLEETIPNLSASIQEILNRCERTIVDLEATGHHSDDHNVGLIMTKTVRIEASKHDRSR